MPGGRPSKPLALVQGHRTKSEKRVRAKAESELLTGLSLKEYPDVRTNKVAHREFMRIKKLLKSIGKDDDLSGNILNTHCLLVAECKELEDIKLEFIKTLETFEENALDEDITFVEQMKMKISLQGQILGCDKALMAKRKMLLDISKENIMTISSALRSIPKKEQKKEKSPMTSFLERKQGEVNASQ